MDSNNKFLFPMAKEEAVLKSNSNEKLAQICFLVISIFAVVFYGSTEAFKTFSIIFVSITIEAIPFMLLGTLIGGLIEVFVSKEKLSDIMPKRKVFAVLAGALMGLIFPVCECAIIPVVRKLLEKGIPLGAATAFLIGGPIVNPLVISSTFVAYSYSFEVSFLRTAAGFLTAVFVGVFIETTIKRDEALKENILVKSCSCCDGSVPEGFREKISSAMTHGISDFYDICRFLVIGAFIAALLQTVVPRDLFLAVMKNPAISIILMMALAVVLNLCSEADAFIAASFAPLGVSLPSQLSFMVLGPMFDIKLLLMYIGVFSRKMIITLVTAVILSVFLSMFFMEMIL